MLSLSEGTSVSCLFTTCHAKNIKCSVMSASVRIRDLLKTHTHTYTRVGKLFIRLHTLF